MGCGALIRRADGKILLVRRRRPPETGAWGLPGGKVDWMEPVEAAVRREVAEETGLDIRVVRLLCIVDHFASDTTPPQHWVAPVYLAEPLGSADAILLEPEALSELDWFSLDALPSPLTLATTRAIETLKPFGGDVSR